MTWELVAICVLLRNCGVALVLFVQTLSQVAGSRCTGVRKTSDRGPSSPKMQGVEEAEDFGGDTGEQKQAVCQEDQCCDNGAAERWRPCGLMSEDDGR